jgi:hypothetical protein
MSYTLTATAGPNGSIDPSGVTSHDENSNVWISTSADQGYVIDEFIVDGVHISAQWKMLLMNSDKVASVTFRLLQDYTVTATAGEHGSFAPNDGETSWEEGSYVNISATGDSGYAVDEFWVDNEIQPEETSNVSWSSIDANHTISATFILLPTYIVTVTAGEHGSIVPSGEVEVVQGNSITFLIVPELGYYQDSVTVDGTPLTVIPKYKTFSNVSGDHSISATFEEQELGDFKDIFTVQHNIVFPDLVTYNAWLLNYGNTVGNYGPFVEAYAYNWSMDPSQGSFVALENIDWTTFPPTSLPNHYLPIILGTFLSKGKSYNSGIKARFNKMPLLFINNNIAIALGVIPGSTFQAAPGLDVISFQVKPNEAYELLPLSRLQIPMAIDGERLEMTWNNYSIETGYSAPAPPDFFTADADGYIYTLHFMKYILPDTWQWQRIEIRKYDNTGNEVWRNIDTNNNWAPLGIGLPPPTYNQGGWEGYGEGYPTYTDDMDLSSINFILNIYLPYPYLINGKYKEDENLLGGFPQEQITYDFQFSHDQNFSSLEIDVEIPWEFVSSGRGFFAVSQSVNGALFGPLPWGEFGAEGQDFYTRIRIKDDLGTSLWHTFKGNYGYVTAGDWKGCAVSPYWSEEIPFSELLPSGYRWTKGLSWGQLQVFSGQLILPYVGIAYHYVEGVVDGNESNPTSYKAYMVYNFGLGFGDLIGVDFLTSPSASSNGLPTACQTEIANNKLYIYWGRPYKTIADNGVAVTGFYYMLDIRNLAGTYTHIEWLAPTGLTASGSFEGRLLIIDEQAYICVVANGNFYVMEFNDTVGYQGVGIISGEILIGSGNNPINAFYDNNFSLSIDRKHLYLNRKNDFLSYNQNFPQNYYNLLPGMESGFTCVPALFLVEDSNFFKF